MTDLSSLRCIGLCLAIVLSQLIISSRAADSTSPASASTPFSGLERPTAQRSAEALQPQGFKRKLSPLGRVPNAAQVERLTKIVDGVRHAARAGAEPSREALAEQTRQFEEYLRDNPDSPFNASIRINLGHYYQQRRQFQKSIERWEAAWNELSEYEDGIGREMGDEAVVHYAHKLLVLGRLEALDALAKAQRSRLVKAELATLWERIWEKRDRVGRMTSDSFKCGIYAVDRVANVLVPDQYERWELLETPSSPDGFSLEQLAQVAQLRGVPLTMASLKANSTIPVPCVLHLTSEHYSAVLAEKDGLYYTVDPGVESPAWLSREELLTEASGYLLVPSLQASLFQGVTSTEASRVIGRFSSCPPTDGEDGPCECTMCPCDCPPGSTLAGAGGGASGSGGGGGASLPCTDCETFNVIGLPNWRVSEPYMNVWIDDIPVRYVPAKGPPLEIRLTYRDRFIAPPNSTPRFGSPWRGSLDNVANFGTWWSDLRSIVSYGSGPNSDTTAVDPITHTWQVRLYDVNQNVIGVDVRFQDGSIHRFAGPSFQYGWYLSAIIRADGTALSFTYTGNPVKLTSITDAEGNSSTLSYTNNAYPGSITGIVTPDGGSVAFGYDGSGRLTSIRDAAGVQSQFEYDPNDANKVWKMITPYGTTSFERTTVSGIADRTVVVTRPDGSKEAYALIDDASANGFPTSYSTQPQPLPADVPYANGSYPYASIDVGQRHRRNTFKWNAQRMAAMTGFDVTNPTAAQMKRARVRHWLATMSDYDYSHVSRYLSHQQEGSPDGSIEGAIRWFDYWGKALNAPALIGTNALPRTVAVVMGTGSQSPVPTTYTYNEYNSIGRKTMEVERWLDDTGTARYRTNRWVFAANGIDPLEHYGPNDVLVGRYGYSGYHQVLAATNALNEVTRYSYDSSARLTSVITPSGHLTTNYYSTDNQIRTTVRAMIATNISSAYSTNITQRYLAGTYVRGGLRGSLTNSVTWSIHTDERGLVVTNIQDELGRTIERRYPGTTGNVEKWYYELTSSQPYYANSTSNALLLDRTALVDRLGNTNYTGYDSLRRRAWTINPLSVTNFYGYCDCGSVSTVTNAVGSAEQEVTEYSFNEAGWHWRTVYPGASAITNFHDFFGRLLVVADALGNTTNTYDRLSRLVEIRNSGGLVQRTKYDNEDRALEVTDRNGVTITNTFDSLGRLTTRRGPDVGAGDEKTTYTYTSLGLRKISEVIDAATTRDAWFAYDAAGRKTAETNANTEVIQYTYTAADDLATITDGRSNVTAWGYDAYGRVISKTYANNVTNLTYAYDALGRLSSRWSQGKGVTLYTYNTVGNLTAINYTNSTDISYYYNAMGRLTNMVDAVGVTKFTYSDGLLASEITPWSNGTLTYNYNNARLRGGFSLSQPGGGTFTNGYAYDASKRLVNVTSQAGSFVYTYANSGSSPATLVKQQTIPVTTGTVWITNNFDAAGRMVETMLYGSTFTNGPINSHTYTLNAGNQRTRITRDARDNSNFDHFTEYTYDAIGQIKSASATNLTGGGVQAIEQMGYLYDAGWNLGQRTNNGTMTLFTNSILNQVVKIGASNVSHDNNGNLTANGVSGISYTYDDENQLLKAEVPSSWKTEFVYDGRLRLRIRKEYVYSGGGYMLSSETRYIYDGMRVIQERNSSNIPAVSYTRGNDLSGSLEGAGGIGGLLARSVHSGASPYAISSSAFYHADGNGNITYLIKTDQSVGATYRYGPFGDLLASIGNLASANAYRFSSKEWIASCESYYYGYRYYSPSIQRWLNRDSLGEAGFETVRGNGIGARHLKWHQIGEIINPYSFVKNNSIMRFDPKGLKGRGFFSIVSGIIAGCKKGAPNWSPPSRPGNCADDPDYSLSIQKWFNCQSDSGDGAAECATMCGCIMGQTDEGEGACQVACVAAWASRCNNR